MRNPYVISFGRIPTQYISRALLIDNIIEDLIANLYSAVPFITSFIDGELNLSKFGIGVNISKRSPIASLDYALKEILKKIAQNNKRVLITIDEARKTESMIDFIQELNNGKKRGSVIFNK